MAGQKSSTFSSDLLKLIFNGTSIANLAVDATSSPLTNLYVALHTQDPSGGDQTTSEASYGAYARQAVARSGSGWTVTGASVSPTQTISFPEATSGSGSLTHFSIGVALSGASKILYTGPISPPVAIAANVTPRLTQASTITEA